MGEVRHEQAPLPSAPAPPVWPKRLWVLVAVSAVIGPLLAALFISGVNYDGPGDSGGMTAMSAVVNIFFLVSLWLVALWTRLRRSLVRRGHLRWLR